MARRRGAAAAVAAAASSPALVAAVSVMALVHYSTVFVFLNHLLGLGTAAGAAHAAAFSLVVAACFFSFLCAAAKDPGSVPAAFSPDAEDPQVRTGSRSLESRLSLGRSFFSIFLGNLGAWSNCSIYFSLTHSLFHIRSTACRPITLNYL
jgi:hypothetical protein